MRPSTKTSRALASATALLLFIFAAPAARAEVVETSFASEIGRLGAATAKKQALGEALRRAVGDIVERHVTLEEAEARSGAIESLFLSSPTSFVIRQTVLSESMDEGVVSVSVEADVDEKAILSTLRAEGFQALDPKYRPRILVLLRDGEAERSIAGELLPRLEASGYRAFVSHYQEGQFPLDDKAPDAGKVAAFSRQMACNVALFVKNEPMMGDEGRILYLVDALRGKIISGGWGFVGSEAKPSALAFTQKTITLLNRANWRAGEDSLSLEIRVGGLDRPGLAEKLEEEIGSLAEVTAVRLIRVEPGVAVFGASALDSGMDLSKIFATISFEGGDIAWKSTKLDRGGSPDSARPSLLVEGLWKRK